jgi:hypothetical protein
MLRAAPSHVEGRAGEECRLRAKRYGGPRRSHSGGGTERAAHLVEYAFPDVPVRQWVLTLPPRVRYVLAWNHALCRAVVAVYMRAVLAWLRQQARTSTRWSWTVSSRQMRGVPCDSTPRGFLNNPPMICYSTLVVTT